ncbi:MAG: isoaspartyl peptidase/L-asparaginase [Bacteroidetes bacterium]|nr:isoaspartyl peptidase/L-asparaginase [Bacteroidota bacterium]
MSTFTLAIHGGAGTILKSMLTPELEAKYLQGLQEALDAGYQILEQEGTALNAVEAAIVCLENNELFNAGRGSVFTKKGINEMDAAIMDGNTLDGGAVAGVRNVKNPITLSKEIMLHSGHVMLSGNGAKEFALNRGLELAPDEYFFTNYRYDQWIEIRDSDFYQLDHKEDNLKGMPHEEKKFGTVGAVAVDCNGHIAAGTSTGGMTNKRYGRIGDSPILGAGTYANDATCGISCTGHGEYFMRAVVAYDISCLMEYKGLSLHDACHHVVKEKLVKMGGEGGLIAVDKFGNYDLCYNSQGMYRGVKSAKGINQVAIYKD